MSYDKINGDVGFIDSTHIYENVKTKRRYTSVTTLLGEYAQPFDQDFWSSYKALERVAGKESFQTVKKELLDKKVFNDGFVSSLNISQEDFEKARLEILEEWRITNKESTDRGTAIHLDMENKMYEMSGGSPLQKYGIGGKFSVNKDSNKLLRESSGIYPEYLIYNDEYGIAGQVDLLVRDGNEISILDYKTGKSIDTQSYYNPKTRSHQKMQYPLHTLMDCNFYHYAMQLSTYAWMTQQLNSDFKINVLKLIHFPHEGGEVYYDIPYLKDEVESVLKHFKSKNLSKDRLTRIKF